MSTAPTLDLVRLTSPISAERPAGQFLRDSDYPRFQRAKDLRTVAVSLERKQRDLALYSEEDLQSIPEQDRHVENPDWRLVRDACVEILTDHSKDLWVASWLVEANTRLSGFAGLRDAFQVATLVAEKFWDSIYPPYDEDEGYLGTVSQLASLNGVDGQGTLIAPIEGLALIPGQTRISMMSFRQAVAAKGGELSESEIYALARQADPDRLRDYADDIEQAIAAFDSMNRVLQEKCGQREGIPVAPPQSQIRNTLVECQRAFRLLTRSVLSGTQETVEEDVAVEAPDAPVVVGEKVADVARSQVTNREDAFRVLLKVSEYFRKSEPHSPVSYMLQQAVRFGRMDLPDLWHELIIDRDVLKQLAERTGIELKKIAEDES